MDIDLLTSVLRNNCHLNDATVVAVDLTRLVTNGLGSEFYRAELRYSSKHLRLPNRMVIKRPLQGDRGREEANLYELILRQKTKLPTMGYFGAVDEASDKPLSLSRPGKRLRHVKRNASKKGGVKVHS